MYKYSKAKRTMIIPNKWTMDILMMFLAIRTFLESGTIMHLVHWTLAMKTTLILPYFVWYMEFQNAEKAKL